MSKLKRAENEMVTFLSKYGSDGVHVKDVHMLRNQLPTQGMAGHQVVEILFTLKLRHMITIKKQPTGMTRVVLRPAWR